MDAPDKKDLLALEERVAEIVGQEVVRQIREYAFEYAAKEAELLEVSPRYHKEDFERLCSLRKQYMLNSVVIAHEAARDGGFAAVNFELYKPGEMAEVIGEKYGRARKKIEGEGPVQSSGEGYVFD